MPRVLFVLGGVAVRLPLLNADAHGEGLGLHGNAPAVQHLKGVAGGVAGAENQMAAGQKISALRAGDRDALQSAVPDLKIRQAMLKADVCPQRQQLLPQIFQGDVEIVRPHMGLGVIENLLRRTAFYQFL